MKLFALSIAVLSFSSVIAQPEEKKAESLWTRPLVIGASVSDGFDKSDFFGPKSKALALDLFLDDLVTGEHGKIENKGSMLLFMNLNKRSRAQLDFAKEYKPTVVLSPDFLFWFVYGRLPNAESRLNLLEQGLKLLDELKCPVVVGDIPNAANAVGKMLAKEQVPAPETIAKANKRIKEWIAGKKNIGLVPLAHFLDTVQANEELVIRSLTVPKGKTAPLLQSDNLHPTKPGAKLLALATLDTLQKLTKFPAEQINWAPKTEAGAKEKPKAVKETAPATPVE